MLQLDPFQNSARVVVTFLPAAKPTAVHSVGVEQATPVSGLFDVPTGRIGFRSFQETPFHHSASATKRAELLRA